MPERQVLVQEGAKKRDRVLAPDIGTAWRWIGWFGLVLAVVGLADFALAWYPMNWGSPEWEFGTVTASYSGLPLPTMGLLALIASAVARGMRWQIVVLAVGLLGFALLLYVGFAVFLTTVPMALGAVEGVPQLGIKKAIVKTTVLALAFPGSYVVAGWLALRHVRRAGR